MSTIGLPMTSKRSLRFKRFSWNKATDGTFPPIQPSKDITHNIIMPRITEPAKSALENSTSREAVVGDQNDALSIKHKKQSQVLAAGDVDNRIQNGEEKVDAIALSTITPETGVAKPPATNKKTSKQFGKKRKNVYMGPYWDDEAGSLPTSAGADDVDFDSLLSQVQIRQKDRTLTKPEQEVLSAPKRKKTTNIMPSKVNSDSKEAD